MYKSALWRSRRRMLIYVQTPTQTLSVPYRAHMLLADYVATVLGPAVDYAVAGDHTVMATFTYVRPDGMAVEFANHQSDELGEVIAPYETIQCTAFNGRAGEGSVECSICNEPRTDVHFTRCVHRFHAQCIHLFFGRFPRGQALRCPNCRTEITDEDEWRIYERLAIAVSMM